MTPAPTPIIEPSGTPGRCKVTFLWRPRTHGEQAVVLINTVTDRDRHAGDISGHVMTPRPGGDLLQLTYELDADLRAGYQILPCDRLPGTDRDSWLQVMRTAVPDPGNPLTVPGPPGRRPSSLLELPQAPPQPYREHRPGVPRGRVSEERSGGRRVWVYTPPGSAAGPHPVVVLLDGEVWAGRVAATLDNLVHDGRIPPSVVLMPDSVDRPTRLRELACHEPFVRYLADDLLPWAGRTWRATGDPGLTVIAGQSLGGLTASYAAFLAPERFGNVLSQSGSYWWPDEDPERLTRRYAATPRLPVRFHLEAGRLEWMLLEENRRFAQTLAAQGYEVSFTEYNGGHDPACWLGGLADGLTDLAAGRL
ncbi:enterochelin esterase [Nonomuraea spiralis]|uniref:Enterochelin esterase n=1 Tax=Nonomuraea spiralis TaxID=46182 RepID=A0ABV5IL75_9ACTN|nr:enterochelin esterase [Nonomuraea spiralis]GGT08268.1 enterochelin esterase [Nonomuraea spiralis]